MKNISLIILLALSSSAFASLAITKSDIKFTATGRPSFIKASGEVPLGDSTFNIGEDFIEGSAIVKLDKLNSGIDLRDEHLKGKYLETQKYPLAKLTISKQKISPTDERQILKAVLELHGQKKEIDLETRISRDSSQISMENSFEIQLSDFGIELPSFQGVTAANKVKLNVKTQFKDN